MGRYVPAERKHIYTFFETLIYWDGFMELVYQRLPQVDKGLEQESKVLRDRPVVVASLSEVSTIKIVDSPSSAGYIATMCSRNDPALKGAATDVGYDLQH
jgi:hypothetical protein